MTQSTSNILYLCMTMDVERIASMSPMGGPPDWAFAERSARAYSEVLQGYSFKPTFFIVPDTAEKQSDVFLQLAEECGAELGMHTHPQCWRDHYLDPDNYEYLGGYGLEEQSKILSEGKAQWEDAFGLAPASFRGGNFSANDSTFPILADLGFTHGSVSQPGRVVTKYRASWADAVWDVHRAHYAFRCAEGDLDFIEVPLTSDRNRTDHWTGVGDVRIEGASAEEVVIAAEQEVGRQQQDQVPIKHVCILTHNFVNYSEDGDGSRRDVLITALDGIVEMGNQRGLETRGATTADIRKAYLATERG